MPFSSYRRARAQDQSYRIRAIALAALLTFAAGAQAGEGDEPMFSVSGFGSLGVVHSSDATADFNHSITQPNGAGYTRNWSPTVDSRLGFQLNGTFNDQLSAVVQIISEQQWDGSFTPAVEWANLKYQLTPDFSIRVGRIVLPTLMLLESAKVGYTMPWVRTPQDVSRLFATTNNDGIDATYRFHAGGIKNTVTASYGATQFKTDDHTPEGSRLTGRDMVGLADTLTHGPLTLHAGYLHGRAIIWKFLGAPVPVLAVQARQRFTLWSTGASYDPGNWFITAEALRVASPLLGVHSGWYVGAGPRIGKLTPYLTYAEQRQVRDSAVSARIGQKTMTAGLRMDVADNVDVKVQYEHLKLAAGTAGTLLPQPGFTPGGRAGVISAIVDFIY